MAPHSTIATSIIQEKNTSMDSLLGSSSSIPIREWFIKQTPATILNHSFNNQQQPSSSFNAYWFTSLLQDSTNNSSSTQNITHESIAKTFPQTTENIASITNSVFFIVVYSILLLFILAFFIKDRKVMKRNQKILFILVSLCIIVQYLGLVW